jgi:hypothetical protein
MTEIPPWRKLGHSPRNAAGRALPKRSQLIAHTRRSPEQWQRHNATRLRVPPLPRTCARSSPHRGHTLASARQTPQIVKRAECSNDSTCLSFPGIARAAKNSRTPSSSRSNMWQRARPWLSRAKIASIPASLIAGTTAAGTLFAACGVATQKGAPHARRPSTAAGRGRELPGSRSYAAIGVATGAFAPSVPIGI